ncbi:MAG: Stp1/IreP family PP2C-type Ser/Thr phosphatase [Clostridiales bacterium]|nr:Stp1/IreP family PP2C-type Ser/Thr phosphatase [Clostridiales bacterium]
MKAWGKTDNGLVRTENQDAYYVDLINEDNIALCVVCDGMGGAKAGGLASSLAAETFVKSVKEKLKLNMSAKYIETVARESVLSANRLLYEKSVSDSECSGMGTTLVAVIADGKHAVVANVGDSRAYSIDENNIVRVTRDHSLVEDLLMKGDLTIEEARSHPRKNLITRALGTEETIECDIFTLDIKQGDNILLCSDGLTNPVEDQEILYEVLHGGKKELACDRLIDIANERGGKDNITVVLLEI